MDTKDVEGEDDDVKDAKRRNEDMDTSTKEEELSPESTPTMTKRKTKKEKAISVMKSFKSPSFNRRMSYLVKDLEEVGGDVTDRRTSKMGGSKHTRFEVLMNKKPINGYWGFRRWCFASIATGRVAGFNGLLPLLLYGTESMTVDEDEETRRTCFTAISSKKKRQRSSLSIVQNRTSVSNRGHDENQGVRKSLFGRSNVENRKLMSPTSSSTSLNEDEESVEMTRVSSAPITEAKGCSTLADDYNDIKRDFSESEEIKKAAHRKYTIITSTEDELNEMIRRIRKSPSRWERHGEGLKLKFTVRNVSNQDRRIAVRFRKRADALYFFERTLEAVVHANVRNLCDAVTMNDAETVNVYTGASDYSRMLAFNIVRKDGRSHNALDYAEHYRDDNMIDQLQTAAAAACASRAAEVAKRASRDVSLLIGMTFPSMTFRQRSPSMDEGALDYERRNGCFCWLPGVFRRQA